MNNPRRDTAKRAEELADKYAYPGDLYESTPQGDDFIQKKREHFLAGFHAGRADAEKEIEKLKEALKTISDGNLAPSSFKGYLDEAYQAIARDALKDCK